MSLSAFLEAKSGSEDSNSNEQSTESVPVPSVPAVPVPTAPATAPSNGTSAQPATPQAKEQPAKTEGEKYTILNGDSPIDIPVDAKVKYGDVELTLKDVLNSYETRQQISKRFDEVGKREQRLSKREEQVRKEQAELREINEKFAEMGEQVMAGNPLGALQIAIAMNPKGQEATMENLVKESIKIAENFQNMSEDEQKLFLEKESVAYQKRELAKKEKRSEEKTAREVLHSQYTGFLEKNNLTDEQMDQALERVEQIPELKEQYDKLTDPIERITFVGSTLLGQRFRATIREGINKVAPELADDQKLVLALIEHTEPHFSSDDIADVVSAYLGKNTSAKNEVAPTQDVSGREAHPDTTPDRAPTEDKAEKPNEPVLRYEDLIAKYS